MNIVGEEENDEKKTDIVKEMLYKIEKSLDLDEQ